MVEKSPSQLILAIWELKDLHPDIWIGLGGSDERPVDPEISRLFSSYIDRKFANYSGRDLGLAARNVRSAAIVDDLLLEREHNSTSAKDAISLSEFLRVGNKNLWERLKRIEKETLDLNDDVYDDAVDAILEFCGALDGENFNRTLLKVRLITRMEALDILKELGS